MQNWVREHWRGPVIGLVAFVIGVGIGASGSESDEASKESEAQVAGLQRDIGKAEAKRELAEDEVAELTRELDDAAARTAQLERQPKAPAASASSASAKSEPEEVAVEAEEPAEVEEPPNVIGLPLPAARQVMKQAGYKVAPKNTDTAFGIVVEANYTICSQGKPRAGIVPVLAQKYGC
jgi:septal ring factor EnvC (AmiA/AmiB activator)